MNKDEAREIAWDAYASQSIEFTVSQAFNAGFDAGVASVDRKAVEVLRKTVEQYDGSDNGICAVCRIGHRKYDLKCNIGICEWAECLSHEWREVLAEMGGDDEH